MLYSTYRPALATSAEPARYDRSYADDFGHQHPHQPHNHSSYASASSSAASPSSMTASCDRFESKGQVLNASLLENRLADNNLVRDCSVIGVPQTGGVTITSPPGQMSLAGTVPVAFVALSSPGRERSAMGGEKESKRMKTELAKWLVDYAPAFRQMKGKLMFVESIPRGPAGAVLRHLLVEKATSPPVPGPDKGFFNTVLSGPVSSSPHKGVHLDADAHETASPPKKGVRDSKRRATHSQIERRRREKINDRLVTLRSIVPACAKELEDRRRQKQEEEEEAARVAAGGAPKTYIDAVTGKPKRKRNRKKPDSKKAAAGADKEEELGLHKLEVLTHAINYIFELKAHIHKLETGMLPEHVPTADNPFGVRNKDGSYRQDAKIEDEPGYGVGAGVLRTEGAQPSAKLAQNNISDEHEDVEEDEEEDQLEDDAADGDGEGDEEEEEEEEEDDEPLERRSKKHMSSATSHPASVSKSDNFPVPNRYCGTDTATYSSSSSRGSAEVSPAFSLVQKSPSTISPATTITSPMMSLSAESPIMLPDPAINLPKGSGSAARVSHSPAFPSLPSSVLPMPHGQPPARRDSSSFLFKQLSLTSPNFAPFSPANYSFPPTATAAAAGASGHTRARTATLSFPAYGEESEVRETSSKPRTPGLSDRDGSTSSDASAAALLLNFSTSPEVLRPIGSRHSISPAAHRAASVASSPHTRPVIGLPSNRSRSTFSSPQYRPVLVPPHLSSHSSARPSSISAPNQERADAEEGPIDEPEPLDLASPPHLALDSSPERGLENDQDGDRFSDKTVDEPMPARPIKLEADGRDRGNAMEMDTAV